MTDDIRISQSDISRLEAVESELARVAKTVDLGKLAELANRGAEIAKTLRANIGEARAFLEGAGLTGALDRDELDSVRGTIDTTQGVLGGAGKGFEFGNRIGGPKVGVAFAVLGAVAGGRAGFQQRGLRKELDELRREVNGRIQELKRQSDERAEELARLTDQRRLEERRLARYRASILRPR